MIQRPNLYNLQTRKTSEKGPRVKTYLLKYVTIKNQTCTIERPEKAKNILNRIKLFLNENSRIKRP